MFFSARDPFPEREREREKDSDRSEGPGGVAESKLATDRRPTTPNMFFWDFFAQRALWTLALWLSTRSRELVGTRSVSICS